YRQAVRQRVARGERVEPHGRGEVPSQKLGERDRSFWELFCEFLRLISPHRHQIIAAMLLLTVGIGLRLIPPLGTKVAIDNVLATPPKPLPWWLESWSLPESPWGLLVTIAA